jgi:predicted metal-binding protein
MLSKMLNCLFHRVWDLPLCERHIIITFVLHNGKTYVHIDIQESDQGRWTLLYASVFSKLEKLVYVNLPCPSLQKIASVNVVAFPLIC